MASQSVTSFYAVIFIVRMSVTRKYCSGW